MNRTTAIQRLAVLRKAEWDPYWYRCPACKARKEHGHAAACKMAAFIADVEDEARDRRELRARHKGERETAGEVRGARDADG